MLHLLVLRFQVDHQSDDVDGEHGGKGCQQSTNLTDIGIPYSKDKQWDDQGQTKKEVAFLREHCWHPGASLNAMVYSIAKKHKLDSDHSKEESADSQKLEEDAQTDHSRANTV